MPLAMSMEPRQPQPRHLPGWGKTINGRPRCCTSNTRDKTRSKQWKGLRFGVPFELFMQQPGCWRYYVANIGLDPDQDIQIRVLATRRKWSPTSVLATLELRFPPIRSTNGRYAGKVALAIC